METVLSPPPSPRGLARALTRNAAAADPARRRLTPSERTFQHPGLGSGHSPHRTLTRDCGRPVFRGQDGKGPCVWGGAGICWALSQFLQKFVGPERGPPFRSPGHQAPLAGPEEEPRMATPVFPSSRFLGVPGTQLRQPAGERAPWAAATGPASALS